MSNEQNVEEVSEEAREDLLAQVLSELKAVREERERDKAEFEQQINEAREAAAAARRAAIEQFEPQPDASWIDPRTDRPAPLEEKLDIMERQARENDQPFDRERTKKIILGLPVDDIVKYRYMGRAFDSQEELDAYREKVETEREKTIGRYPR